jgi:hypothetical protein
MLELVKTFSDDQIALLGCAAALSVAGTIMSLSYYIGRGRIVSTAQQPGKSLVFAPQVERRQPSTAASTAASVVAKRDAA